MKTTETIFKIILKYRRCSRFDKNDFVGSKEEIEIFSCDNYDDAVSFAECASRFLNVVSVDIFFSVK